MLATLPCGVQVYCWDAHDWAADLLQVNNCSCVPGVFVEPGSSRHLPELTLIHEPFGPAVQFCAAEPLHVKMSILFPGVVDDIASSRHSRPVVGTRPDTSGPAALVLVTAVVLPAAS